MLSILIIRRDNIGDLVCTTPMIAALREMLPSASIGMLVNTYNAEVVEGNPVVDQIHRYTKLKHRSQREGIIRSWWNRWCFLRELRREHYQVAILARSEFDQYGLRFAKQLAIPRVIGFSPRDGSLPSASGLTDLVTPLAITEAHHVESLWPLLRVLGSPPTPGPLQVFPRAELVEEQWLREVGEKPVVAVHISARESSRRLGRNKWVEVIEGLHRRSPEFRILLLWSPGQANDPMHPGDDELAAAITKHCVAWGLPLLPCPTQRLGELIALLSLCHGFIGADGGAMHVAAALQLPCVALFENLPHKYKHWYPWKTRHELVIAPRLEIGDIEPAAVVDAWLKLTAA